MIKEKLLPSSSDSGQTAFTDARRTIASSVSLLRPRNPQNLRSHRRTHRRTGAEQLGLENKYQFQYWALGLCRACPTEGIKKGADRGIDGRLFFHEAHTPESKQIIFSIKGGLNIGVAEIRDLIGVLQREQAEIGVYISFAEPTKPMRKEAAEAGFYTSADGSRYPRLQLLTIKGLLEGTEHLQRPLHVRDVTFRKAPRTRPTPSKNLSLNLGS